MVGTTSTGQLQTIDEITVEVRNRTDHTVRPHFSVLVLGHTTSFWYPFDGLRASVVILPAHDPGAAARLAQATGQAPVTVAG